MHMYTNTNTYTHIPKYQIKFRASFSAFRERSPREPISDETLLSSGLLSLWAPRFLLKEMLRGLLSSENYFAKFRVKFLCSIVAAILRLWFRQDLSPTNFDFSAFIFCVGTEDIPIFHIYTLYIKILFIWGKYINTHICLKSYTIVITLITSATSSLSCCFSEEYILFHNLYHT